MAKAFSPPRTGGEGPQTCPWCGSQSISEGLSLNQNAEIGRIGLPYRVRGIFIGTEPLRLDLCENCGTVQRFFVEEPRRNWKT